LVGTWSNNLSRKRIIGPFEGKRINSKGFLAGRLLLLLLELDGVVGALVHAGAAIEAFLLIYDGDIFDCYCAFRTNINTCATGDALFLRDLRWHSDLLGWLLGGMKASSDINLIEPTETVALLEMIENRYLAGV
jgi:hypothetical protein